MRFLILAGGNWYCVWWVLLTRALLDDSFSSLGWFPPMHVFSWILRGTSGPLWSSPSVQLCPLWDLVLDSGSHVSLGSGSLIRGVHVDFPSLQCSMNTLKAVSWGNSRVYLICVLSLRDHFCCMMSGVLKTTVWHFVFWLFLMKVEAHNGS